MDTDLGQKVRDDVHLALAVASGVLVDEGDGVPEHDSLLHGHLKSSESFLNLCKLLAHLPEEKREGMSELGHKYPCLFRDFSHGAAQGQDELCFVIRMSVRV